MDYKKRIQEQIAAEKAEKARKEAEEKFSQQVYAERIKSGSSRLIEVLGIKELLQKVRDEIWLTGDIKYEDHSTEKASAHFSIKLEVPFLKVENTSSSYSDGISYWSDVHTSIENDSAFLAIRFEYYPYKNIWVIVIHGNDYFSKSENSLPESISIIIKKGDLSSIEALNQIKSTIENHVLKDSKIRVENALIPYQAHIKKQHSLVRAYYKQLLASIYENQKQYRKNIRTYREILRGMDERLIEIKKEFATAESRMAEIEAKYCK